MPNKLPMKTTSVLILTSLGFTLAACGDNSMYAEQPLHTPSVLLARTVTSEPVPVDAVASIAGYRRDYTIVVDGKGVTVTNKSDHGDVQKFSGVAMIKFIDRYTNLEVDSTSGQVYRLYQAAFNRKPDPTGLGFWIYNAEASHLTMESVAAHFLDSAESIGLYGRNPTNAQLVTAAYTNVLHRAPEPAGFDWWVGVMNDGVSTQSMLYSFSESPENKKNLLPAMAHGIDYVPYMASLHGNPSIDIARIIANVRSSNIDFRPAHVSRAAGTWHWSGSPARPVMVYVPQPGNRTEQEYASKVNQSISQINNKLAGALVLEAVTAIPRSGNYIRVSYDTAYVPPGSTNYSSFCANVSTGPRLGTPISPDRNNGIAAPVYLNLGNGRCNVSQDIVTHEFGHALGLANHFDGFGANNTPPISSEFWDVLATLYGNPRSTPASDLIVKPAR